MIKSWLSLISKGAGGKLDLHLNTCILDGKNGLIQKHISPDDLRNLGFDCVIINSSSKALFEYVSKNKVELLNNLIRIYDCKLLCVGDDWQSIYRFAGSDTNLFTSFEKYISFSELLKIETAYRNSQELINASSYFIQQNSEFSVKFFQAFSFCQVTKLVMVNLAFLGIPPGTLAPVDGVRFRKNGFFSVKFPGRAEVIHRI